MISAEAEYFSLQGVEQVLEVMGLARENLNERLEWLGVVLNMTDLRMLHSRETHKTLRESFGDKVFDTVIRKSIRYPESAERGLSILDYRPELGRDYIELADELLARWAKTKRASASRRAARRDLRARRPADLTARRWRRLGDASEVSDRRTVTFPRPSLNPSSWV